MQTHRHNLYAFLVCVTSMHAMIVALVLLFWASARALYPPLTAYADDPRLSEPPVDPSVFPPFPLPALPETTEHQQLLLCRWAAPRLSRVCTTWPCDPSLPAPGSDEAMAPAPPVASPGTTEEATGEAPAKENTAEAPAAEETSYAEYDRALALSRWQALHDGAMALAVLLVVCPVFTIHWRLLHQ
jgi:hypothetical protein